jgi:hypothetical protein
MGLRHLIIATMLAGFAPAHLPLVTIDKAEAAQTSQTVKKKKKKVVEKKQQPRVKQNFRAPRPGEPDAGWTDDCLFYYQVYGKTPAYCGKYGRGFRMWDW